MAMTDVSLLAVASLSSYGGPVPAPNSFSNTVPDLPSQPSGFTTSRRAPVAQVTPVPTTKSSRAYFAQPNQHHFCKDRQQDEDAESITLRKEWERLYASASREEEDWEYVTIPDTPTSQGKILNPNHIPDYVFAHAPLVHLFSGETYWPGDMTEHLEHITVYGNDTALGDEWQHLNLDNLDLLNQLENGKHVYLTSNDNVVDNPEWMLGKRNIPEKRQASVFHIPFVASWTEQLGLKALETLRTCMNGVSGWLRGGLWSFYSDPRGAYRSESDRVHPVDDPRFQAGRSTAPAVLLTVDKGNGVVDAFWFFFYSFNLGNGVFSVRFGHHLGDWEHCAIRFQHGEPKAVFFSEHEFGHNAFTYEAVEKVGKRPLIYSAVGTHAMYPTPGAHPYVLPMGILKDRTDRGPLWDPLRNAYTYTYDFNQDLLRASDKTPDAPIGWFHYAGRWGDKIYPNSDDRQYHLFSEYHYVSGPLGPKFKNLGRKAVCENEAHHCVIKTWLGYF